jgi:hypothetical protein
MEKVITISYRLESLPGVLYSPHSGAIDQAFTNLPAHYMHYQLWYLAFIDFAVLTAQLYLWHCQH